MGIKPVVLPSGKGGVCVSPVVRQGGRGRDDGRQRSRQSVRPFVSKHMQHRGCLESMASKKTTKKPHREPKINKRGRTKIMGKSVARLIWPRRFPKATQFLRQGWLAGLRGSLCCFTFTVTPEGEMITFGGHGQAFFPALALPVSPVSLSLSLLSSC